jgi:acyl carrier protein
MQKQQIPDVSGAAELQREVADLIVECLNLEVTADEIKPDEPLYGEGLGLDSIDILEIAMNVSKRYGLELRDDYDNVQHIFNSLRNLTDYIAARRAR